MCRSCKKFAEMYPMYLDENITRKIYEVICTVPRFVQEQKTLGLFCEQLLESLHATVNVEIHQLVSVKNKAEKLHLAFVRQELCAITDKTEHCNK